MAHFYAQYTLIKKKQVLKEIYIDFHSEKSVFDCVLTLIKCIIKYLKKNKRQWFRYKIVFRLNLNNTFFDINLENRHVLATLKFIA